MTIDFKISADSFKTEYQERLPFIMKGALETSMVKWSDINDVIARCDVQSENFRLSFPDGNVSKEKYVKSYFHVGDMRRALHKPALYDFMRKGATLVANHIYNEPVVNDYAKDIAQFTGRQTVTSLYVAFGETDSYRAHWDSRDVFAVQLKGRKRWIVYPPSFDAPLYMHQSKYLEHDHPCPEQPYLDFILEEGDVFYIPRGWWHNVTPLGEPTVHLAIGTFPAFATDYVRWIFGKLPDSIYARTALENHQQDKDTIKVLSEHISELMNDPQCYQAFIESHFSEQVLETRLNLEKLADENQAVLQGHVRVRFNVLRSDFSDVYLITNIGKFSFKDELAELRRFLIEHPLTTVAEILGNFAPASQGEIAELLYLLASKGVIELF
jgi:ribosomal protein L16 Arg81 hydroxylase